MYVYKVLHICFGFVSVACRVTFCIASSYHSTTSLMCCIKWDKEPGVKINITQHSVHTAAKGERRLWWKCGNTPPGDPKLNPSTPAWLGTFVHIIYCIHDVLAIRLPALGLTHICGLTIHVSRYSNVSFWLHCPFSFSASSSFTWSFGCTASVVFLILNTTTLKINKNNPQISR